VSPLIKHKLGSLLLDVPGNLARLARPGGWVGIVNRLGETQSSDSPFGVKCLSSYTSTLHAADMFPRLGRSIQNRALADWPVEFAPEVCFSDQPDVTFVIPHRGDEREALLNLTIRSIAALRGKVECLVVEQDAERRLGDLPGNTRHLLAPHPTDNNTWHKALAFNLGVSQSLGKVIVCQDSDIPVPKRYLEIIQRHLFDENRDVVYPQRFLFHLTEEVTKKVIKSRSSVDIKRSNPETIRQNWTGGTLAIRRDAYFRIGGFDESFSDWSGEDREFYDRCQVLNSWCYGYVPFLHLWHQPQVHSRKAELREASRHFTESKLATPRDVRIRNLVKTNKQRLNAI
jgi:hypothetical protein